jgi:hypothetical protein
MILGEDTMSDEDIGYQAEETSAAALDDAVDNTPKAKTLYDMFETDNSLETKGVTVDYGEAGQFQVARAGGANKHYVKVVERVMRPYRRQFELGTLDEDVALGLAKEIFAEAIVLAWEGVRNREGELLPFTKENCVMLFTDLPDLFMDLQDFSSKAVNFHMDDVEGDSKN